EMLAAVGLPDPAALCRRYPHQLSGGMGQRVMLAIALINDPQLLIADEPTSALDHQMRDQVLQLIDNLVAQRNMGLILISHDLQMMSKWADRVNVLYCGQTVESAQCEELLAAPHHPYTQALIRAMPDFGRSLPHKSRLNTLPGAIPSLEHLP
ncbi:oligopeptide/dipeptide ABC transporter ATP-binding protein, partial [Aeromonas hydrophila]|uniref:oligopeptide/dipeptide ABC transporter ATP-binding protein n=1 Tax=Aeromonas hydrophila TaxID=644 RepID=UPI002B059ED7